jgi:hypothetical protein
MKIALDYDNTFTRDPDLWICFVGMAYMRGHEVTIVTSRNEATPVPVTGIEVIYCAFKAKDQHYDADVWIDDDPKHIHHDHGHYPP